MWPLLNAEKRGDFSDPKAWIFKLMSGAVIIYSCWSFCQDEKNVKDLKDFAKTGVNDLLDYGTEWISADHALEDHKNKTASAKEKSFKDKIKDQMNVNVDKED